MIGKTVSHYQILEKVGGGGMGVVYTAEDTKLKRNVALKFLPADLTRDEQAKERFIHEAQAASALDHPNICTIHEIDETDDGQLFIAMPYYAGETLQEKITRGPLKIADAINIAIQVSQGLANAHAQGIFHRDIKPANILLTESGVAKIVDFGLAKLTGRTLLTQEGTTLGTVPYMSPEQARGEEVDYRTDIFSLGVVLYEMVAGRVPFPGEYEQAIVYGILNLDPEPLTGIRTGVPMDLERIVSKLMAKDRDGRYQHIDELPVDLRAVDLTSVSTSCMVPSPFTTHGKRQNPIKLRRFATIATIIAGLVIGFTIWHIKSEEPETSVVRSTIVLMPSEQIDMAYSALLSISPNGKTIVYAGGSDRQLYFRHLDNYEPVLLPGTNRAMSIFFSTDSRWIGYFADGKIKKISIDGGLSQVICEANPFYSTSASWGDDGTIVFENNNFGLSRVPATGGIPDILTEPDRESGEIGCTLPKILPGSKAVLFQILHRNEAITAVMNMETGNITKLFKGGSHIQYVPTGHIIYTQSGSLLAIPFDMEHLAITGQPELVLDNISYFWSMSNNGILVYLPRGVGSLASSLVWIDRLGIEIPFADVRFNCKYPRIAPDGRHVAVPVYGRATHIQIFDAVSGIPSRLTFDEGYSSHPVWSPDGNTLVFSSNRKGSIDIFSKPANGSGEATLIFANEYAKTPNSWLPGSQMLAFTEVNPVTQEDIWILSIRDNSATPFLVTPSNESAPVFSTDGKWIAYSSDESGRREVYVQPYPATGAKYQISTAGGVEPVWAPDTHALYFRWENKIMSVAVETAPNFSKTGEAQEIFECRFPLLTSTAMYDVHPDGDKFFVAKLKNEAGLVNQICLITNFHKEIVDKFNTGN